MAKAVELPIIDLNSPDPISAAHSIREACTEYGFFYLLNHGIDEELLHHVFLESRNFLSLPLEEKMKLVRSNHRGYTPLLAENLAPNSSCKGVLPCWRSTMEDYYRRLLNAGKRLISMIAVALNLNEDYFEKLGALSPPDSFLHLLHYPGELGSSGEEIYGVSAHSDYGMITLLATDGVAGLQACLIVCRDKLKQPQVWEDVHHINGAFIVYIGEMMERWTNCLFRSILHRVMRTGRECYSMTFFLHPNPDCVIECLKSCFNESSPPRFLTMRSGDYLEERFKLTYAS